MKQNNLHARIIQQLLNWDELQYGQFIYDCGLQYLHQYIIDDADGIATLERSRIFWTWWRNHWMQRDEQFIQKANVNASAHVIQMFYEHHNNIKKLANSVWPNAVILHESYAQMIGAFNDEITAQ